MRAMGGVIQVMKDYSQLTPAILVAVCTTHPFRSASSSIWRVFSCIGSVASIQCMANPLRSIPRNHVICLLAN